MKRDQAGPPAILAFWEVALNSGQARFDLSLMPGDLALFEVEPGEHAGWLGDLALGLVAPLKGDVRFRGASWAELSRREEERYRKMVCRVLMAEEETPWRTNVKSDEDIRQAPQFDPEQGAPELANLRAMPVEQRVRAWLPEELALLILERPLREATDEGAASLLQNVAIARERGTAVLWVEDAGRPLWQAEPTWHFPEVPEALRPER